jgi:phthiocerol/phenolphthiocerol synthesis type-I polyketide synthase C
MKDFAVHRLRDDIAVVGWSCRLPGANSVDELWALLLEERCAVSRVPADRFSLERFGHPRKQEPGKSYTWAAGILDDVWGFDPAVFGISPREAVQIDPQQRILLQLTWEALEDAGIRPSSIVSSDVGVFIGASQTDYGHAFFSDPAIADAHFAPGTAVAVLANRISYIFGLRGPSITIDTACSSSLVALHQAVEAIRSGRIDTAIVGGSNLIASPASFIAFSQANMLSATGLCQSFSAQADGFVRAEGAVVLVLRKAAHASASANPIHGLILASDVNSDGRKNGISLPSADAQEALLGRIYARNDIDTNKLAFVEAHGTGTPVGDPIEATAIGLSIGRNRTSPLPIGSIKTNIGHLEPASGLAGVLKALLALNHGVLPPSLHFDEPNPHIKFDKLNLSVCTQPLLLPNSASQYAGVNSFGFGGTNAHAVVAAGRKPIPAPVRPAKHDSPGVFAISANSNNALVALAGDYVERVSQLSDSETATLSSAIVHRRDRHPNRIVVSSTRTEEVLRGLKSFINGSEDPALTIGNAVADEMPIAFVYSGNGSQWAGMGLSAYRHSAAFRARFEEVDACFNSISGWSLKDMLFSEELQERLPLTAVAQPLIFGIQSACTAALRASGLRPSAVLGHSVGEVAAAEAAGILDLRAAVKVIHFRSMHQERTHNTGRMAAVLGSAESVRELAAAVPGIEIAAINSPRAVTVAGSKEALERFKVVAADRGVAMLDLDLDYPFHTGLMAPIEHQLRADWRDLSARDADVPFVSTVTGACLPGSRLDGNYWWRNVREPVQFVAAVRAAAQLGARYFVEIGPRPTLFKHITDSLQGEVNGFAALSVLDRNDEIDPFLRVRAKALVTGARVDTETIFGANPGPGISLPSYPWQQSPFRFKSTVEGTGGEVNRHPFAGVRSTPDEQVWRAHIDTLLCPDLADHKVGDQVLFPGAGFLEIALWVARQWLRTDNIILSSFEIFNPLDLTGGETREVMTRVSPGSSTLEIFSRPRLSQASWLIHCRCKIQTGNMSVAAPVRFSSKSCRELTQADVYDIADASGLRYGPAFRLVRSAVVSDDGFISVDLAASKAASSITPFTLDPMRLDAGAHGFFTVFPEVRALERGVTYIPVRFDEVILYRPELRPERTLIEITSKNERSIVGDCYVFGADDTIIAVLRGVRTQAIATRRTRVIDSVAFIERPCLIDGGILGDTGVGVTSKDVIASADALGMIADDSVLSSGPDMLLEGWATAAAYEIASAFAEASIIDTDSLAVRGRLPKELRNWLAILLAALETAGLARRKGQVWTLVPDLALPSSTSVVKVLAMEQQAHAAETLLAAAISGFVDKIAQKSDNEFGAIVPNAALDFYHDTNIELRETSDALHLLLQNIEQLWPTNRSLRILQLGYSRLATSLLSSQRNMLLTIFEPNRRRYESAELALANAGDVCLVDADHIHELGSYDLIVGVSALHRLQKCMTLPELRSLLAPGGLLVAAEPGSSLFKDIVFGLDPAWFLKDARGEPASPLRPIKHWVGMMAGADFRNSRRAPLRCGSSLSFLVVAERAAHVASASLLKKAAKAETLIITPKHRTELVDGLHDALKGGLLVTSAVDDLLDSPPPFPDTVLMVPDFSNNLDDPVEALTRRCLDLKICAERTGNGPLKLWLLFCGALTSNSVSPVETGAWAFSRTLANEYPKLDVRRIDITRNLPTARAVELIQKIVFSGTDETEMQIDENGVRAVRVEALGRAIKAKASAGRTAAQLERRSESGERLSWRPIDRRDPRADEVEIEVAATGLNFRDLMWSLSLLPEEMLEGGFSGAALGLECAGRIARVGAGVKNLKVDDRVMAFAASSFATHVCVKSGQAVKLPETISVDAAATIPVAFFTAYYSLVTQAKLSRREWILIHGGAGAVGMAAIQVAHSRGAKVIATAGSSAKRDLLRSLGVSHVLDSRSTSFVDDVRGITGIGVDVVLNSLAGEPMERSIGCLRPARLRHEHPYWLAAVPQEPLLLRGRR